jgi:hypothetical protein
MYPLLHLARSEQYQATFGTGAVSMTYQLLLLVTIFASILAQHDQLLQQIVLSQHLLQLDCKLSCGALDVNLCTTIWLSHSQGLDVCMYVCMYVCM